MDTALNRSVYVQLRFFVPKLLKDKEFEASFTYSPYQKEINEYGPNKTQKVTLKRNVHADRDDMLAFESPKIYIHKQYNSVWEPAIKRKDRQDGRSNGAHVIIRYKNSKSTIDQVHIPWYYEYENRIYERKYKTTAATNAQNPNHNKQTAICPHNQDGAIEVAKYIVGEIKRNVKSLVAQKIRYLIESEPLYVGQVDVNEMNYINALTLWTEKVGDKKDWDHKPKISNKSELKAVAVHRVSDLTGRCLTSHYHKYRDFDYFYDVWSNIHYGYVGLSVGFDENTLLLGSNTQQFFQSFLKIDTPDDITTMKIGFELHKKFGKYAEKLKPQDVLDILDKTPQSKFPTSKKTHICHDKTAQRCKK